MLKAGVWLDLDPCYMNVMNVALTRPWTVERFLAWADRQEGRYEFDGVRPVAMTGGTADHNRMTINILAALRSRLRGTACAGYGPDLGIRTGASRVRYPDALVTCTKFPGTERLAPDPVVVFEVLSAESGRRDRIEKVPEYAAVPSIRRYVIVESASSGLFVLHRQSGNDAFTATTLTGDELLALREIGIAIPVAEFYEGVAFDETPTE
jgi:Uma2 family endonuclease